MRKIPDPQLVSAYEATIFAVFGEHPANISVADAPARHDDWLAANKSQSAVVITAWNPLSQQLPRPLNNAANLKLQSAIESAGLRFAPARGSDPSGEWYEDSFAVFDVPDDVLESWLSRFCQNAAIRVRVGERPDLVWNEQ